MHAAPSVVELIILFRIYPIFSFAFLCEFLSLFRWVKILDFTVNILHHDFEPFSVRLVANSRWNSGAIADPGWVLVDDILPLCVGQRSPPVIDLTGRPVWVRGSLAVVDHLGARAVCRIV